MRADLSTRDLFNAPSLMSLARLPLALYFPFVVDRPRLALSVLTASGVSDVMDGHFARRLNQVTATGAVLDGVTDKLFVLSVASSLLATKRLSSRGLALLAARELVELPLALWLARSDRHVRASTHTANALGKVATLLQFTATAASLFGKKRAMGILTAAAAITGALAALSYWRRALR